MVAKSFDNGGVLSYLHIVHGMAELLEEVHGLLLVTSIATEEVH